MPEMHLTREDEAILDRAYSIIDQLALDERDRTDPSLPIGRALAGIYDVQRTYRMPRRA